MSEQQTVDYEHNSNDEKRKLLVSQICMEAVKNFPPTAASMPSSPTGHRKTCLCSPTTHPGSFRCRYHRNSKLTRASMSVASNLSELGSASVASKLSELAARK
ncbi:unnamed protein product [Cuscuta campestris]|uniref:Uncharacterized protein n=2 Tax=Cuscuta sect. Cleistogrammica TaxID=1824901 RepID=A0A484NI55_9ASTE|nr:unnamed protein product [Cuscuta campestris]